MIIGGGNLELPKRVEIALEVLKEYAKTEAHWAYMMSLPSSVESLRTVVEANEACKKQEREAEEHGETTEENKGQEAEDSVAGQDKPAE